MDADEFAALMEAGIIDHKIELIDGRPMMGEYPLGFSAEQIRAAAELGIELLADGSPR